MDEEEFDAAAQELLAEFAAHTDPVTLAWVEDILELKGSYLGGNPRTWAPQEIDEILLEIYPAKVVVELDEMPAIPSAFAELLHYLDYDDLASVVARSTSAFISAMTNEDNWSFGKRLTTTAAGDGIDFSDQDAFEAWIAGFNERPIGERDQILGPSLPNIPPGFRPGTGRGYTPIPLPPVVLPTDAEVAAAALGSTTLTNMIGLVDYIGSGRTLTQKGNLKLADARELVALLDTGDKIDEVIGDKTFRTQSSAELGGLDWIFQMCLNTALVKRTATKVVPAKNAALVDDPAELAYVSFLAVLQTGGPTTHRYRIDRYGFGWYAEVLDENLTPMLLEFYRDPEPRPIDELSDTAWHIIQGEFDLADATDQQLDFAQRGVETSLRRALRALRDLGLLTVHGETPVKSDYGTTRTTGGTVALTGLGKWCFQRFASSFTDAPVIGALRDADAAHMFGSVAHVGSAQADAEIAAWTAHHGADAPRLIVDALDALDETGRGLAMRTLVAMGPDAHHAVQSIATDPAFRDFATLFRIDVLGADPGEADRSHDPAAWVRFVASATDVWGPQAAASVWAERAAGSAGIDAMLDVAWRVGDAATEIALGTVGGHHPDKRIAKAARKALFKHRSSR